MRRISVKELVELLSWRWALVLLVGIILLTADDVARLLEAKSWLGTASLVVCLLIGAVAAMVCLLIVWLGYASELRGRAMTVAIAATLIALLIGFRASHPRFGGDHLDRGLQVVLVVLMDVFLICFLAAVVIAGRRRDHHQRDKLAAEGLVAED